MFRLVLAALVATTAIAPAQAVTIFTDRAAFDAATNAPTARTFPTTSINATGPVYTFNGVTFDTSLALQQSILQDGLYQRAVYLATSDGTITIRSTQNAIGLYLGSADGARSFGYNANGTSGTFTTLASTNNGGKFIGFSDTVPIAVTFSLTTGREFDIVSFVTTTNAVPPSAVPEPASWAMMIGGFGLVGGTLRRRRSSVRTTVRFA